MGSSHPSCVFMPSFRQEEGDDDTEDVLEMSEKIPLSDFLPRRDRRGGCCVERSNVEKDSPRSEKEIHVMRKC